MKICNNQTTGLGPAKQYGKNKIANTEQQGLHKYFWPESLRVANIAIAIALIASTLEVTAVALVFIVSCLGMWVI